MNASAITAASKEEEFFNDFERYKKGRWIEGKLPEPFYPHRAYYIRKSEDGAEMTAHGSDIEAIIKYFRKTLVYSAPLPVIPSPDELD